MTINSSRPIIQKVNSNQDPEWTRVKLRTGEVFTKKWLIFVPDKVDKALNNTWEQVESTKKSIGKYIDVDTTWWKKIDEPHDFSWIITDVIESPDWNISQISYTDKEKIITHNLYQENEELRIKLSRPEEYLTKLFGLRKDQFMRDWKLIMSERIKFDQEQSQKVQQLLQSQELQLPGYRHSDGDFVNTGELGCLWTNIPGVYIKFNKYGLSLASEKNTKLAFSAFYLEK